MATNDFKPFATGAGANVMPQQEWQDLPALLTGFAGGKASSAQVNKVLRQTSFIAAALAQFVSDKSGQDVLDDGDIAAFLAKLTGGFGKQYLSRQNPFADIKADGAAAVSSALANLGLGEGSALPVGVPVPWPLSIPPAGWLKCNGAAFSAVQYPKLALVYPALALPDLRGEFIRGWDDGRGVDSGRSLLSVQMGSLMALSISGSTEDDVLSIMHVYGPPDYKALIDGVGMDSMSNYQKPFGVNRTSSNGLVPYSTATLGTIVSGQPAVGGVSRPRNVAFNFIVRAA